MGITFTSWAACDDGVNPTLDWSSASGLRGRLPRRFCEAIRQALIERAADVGIDAGYIPACLAGTTLAPQWFDRFDTEMSSTLVAYVDHRDHAGDWSGLAPAFTPPLWTESAILAAIGAPARLPPPASMEDWGVAEWIYQQYQILNMLRIGWAGRLRFVVFQGGSPPAAWLPQREGSTANDTWANTVAAYNAAPWAYDASPGVPHNFSLMTMASDGSWAHAINAYRVWLYPSLNPGCSWGPTDAYVAFARPDLGGAEPPDVYEYANADFAGAPENLLCKLPSGRLGDSGLSGPDGVWLWSNTDNTADEPPTPALPAPGDPASHGVRGWILATGGAPVSSPPPIYELSYGFAVVSPVFVFSPP